MYNCRAHNIDTLKDHFMTHLSISFRNIHDKITTCFNWGFIDNLIILLFLKSDLSLAIAYCTQSIISVVNFKGLNFQRFGKLY